MAELLLLSNSTAPGMGFLEHAGEVIDDVLGGRRSVLFVPFASGDPLSALGLIPFQLNPHYLDPDPRSRHQGETRQQRIEEFLEENDAPVLGLREGSWLRVSGQRAELSGSSAGRLFRRHAEPTHVPVGADLSWLLGTRPRFDVGAGA